MAKTIDQIESFKRLVVIAEGIGRRNPIPDETSREDFKAVVGGAEAILEISGCRDSDDRPDFACPEYVERLRKVMKEHGYA